MQNTDNDADVPDNRAEQSGDPLDTSGAESESGPGPDLPRTSNAPAHSSGAAAEREESMIDETLHHALNDLEQILERRQSSKDPHATAQPAGETFVDEDTDQYTIPLLDEVVRPGNESQVSPPPVKASQPQVTRGSDSRNELPDDSEPALRRRLAERLASEIEIITQHHIEAALEKAHEEIREQVRNHLDIILPEVVEELSQVRRRRNGDPEH